MMIDIMLYGKRLGFAEWNAERGTSIFQYEAGAIGGIEPSPIIMPTEGRIYETNRDHANFNNLPYVLSDSMPDDFGNIMMKTWLKQRELSYGNINPVDRLTYVGLRGMGALEYLPEANHGIGKDSHINVGELVEVAKRVLEDKQGTSYDDLDQGSLTDILRIGTSVGGARAKGLIAIKRDDQQSIVDIRPGDIIQPKGYSYWLLKIDGANEKTLGESEGMGKIEYAYYLMAKASGIEMSESSLHEENGRYHFLTKRFDRTDEGKKIHMQTLGALAGIDYKVPKASSYETLFRVMKRLRLPYDQFGQQYRRMLFNVLARNHDDHVKNFSFLMNEEGSWKISPAYDLTFSHKPGGTWTDVHQSSINGKYDNFTKEELLGFGKEFGIKKAEVIFEEVMEGVNQWSTIAGSIDIPKVRILEIDGRLRTRHFI